MRTDDTPRAVEAILMVADEPVDAAELASLVDVSTDELHAVVAELTEAYEAERRGFVVAEVAGGYRFQSHPDLAPYIERFVLEGQTARLSQAALETLAIVAYKQPIARAQIAAIRGVSVDGVIRTLEQRGYIAEVGRDPGPGNPVLFGTTDQFLERLGLASLSGLPPLAQFVPDADVVEQLEHGLRVSPIILDPVVADPVLADAVVADPVVADPSGPGWPEAIVFEPTDIESPAAVDQPDADVAPDGAEPDAPADDG